MKSNSSNKEFYTWFREWYTNNERYELLEISFSMPSKYMLPTAELPEGKVIFLDFFYKIDASIDVKPFLTEVLDKADEYGLIIFMEAIPRIKYISKIEDKKEKVTTLELEDYFSKFGFRSVGQTLMMRKSNISENIKMEYA